MDEIGYIAWLLAQQATVQSQSNVSPGEILGIPIIIIINICFDFEGHFECFQHVLLSIRR